MYNPMQRAKNQFNIRTVLQQSQSDGKEVIFL